MEKNYRFFAATMKVPPAFAKADNGNNGSEIIEKTIPPKKLTILICIDDVDERPVNILKKILGSENK